MDVVPFHRSAGSVKISLPGLVLCLGLLVIAGPAHSAVKCRVSTPTLAFGTYSAGTSQDLDTTAMVEMDCRGGRGLVTIKLAAGSSGDMENRYMVSGANTLSYNAYLNVARTVIWGDGSGSTVPVVRILTTGRTVFGIPVYGRIFSGQNPMPGVYADSVVVTAVF